MGDLMQEKINILSQSLSMKEDSIITSTISAFLGHSNWRPEDIRLRGAWITFIDKPHERTLQFDGVPLLWLHDPEPVKTDDPYTIRYEQKYKILFDNKTGK